MRIEYKTVDFKTEIIELGNAIDIRINGIKIIETKSGINLNSDKRIVVKPNSSNSIDVSQEEF